MRYPTSTEYYQMLDVFQIVDASEGVNSRRHWINSFNQAPPKPVWISYRFLNEGRKARKIVTNQESLKINPATSYLVNLKVVECEKRFIERVLIWACVSCWSVEEPFSRYFVNALQTLVDSNTMETNCTALM